jgi:hypothetical protein
MVKYFPWIMVIVYEFESADQLLEDFWISVDYYMENYL